MAGAATFEQGRITNPFEMMKQFLFSPFRSTGDAIRGTMHTLDTAGTGSSINWTPPPGTPLTQSIDVGQPVSFNPARVIAPTITPASQVLAQTSGTPAAGLGMRTPARAASSIMVPPAPVEVPTVSAQPEAGTKLPYNTLAWALGQAASAVMGPFQDTPAAKIGQASSAFAEQRAQHTYAADILAGRTPDASVAALVSPETELQTVALKENLDASRAQREQAAEQLKIDKQKLDLEARKVALQESEAGISHEEFKASLEQEAVLNKLRNETMIEVAKIQNSDNRTDATRAVDAAIKVYAQTLNDTFGDEGAALTAYNNTLRAQGHPELIAQESPQATQIEDPFADRAKKAGVAK